MAEEEVFIQRVWDYYNQHKRELPWRDIADLSIRDRSYIVMVSEVMLQQTQVNRVIPKFGLWMQAWPSLDAFVSASLADVLRIWSGLGYNRRAKYLYSALHTLYKDYDGTVPSDTSQLVALPGIGKNTAAAIVVYTHNIPLVFIETNIRTVYLHEFYKDSAGTVSDKSLESIVQKTMSTAQPRLWYYALMDYGSYIKKEYGTYLHKVSGHKKQSPFKGSKREIRGKVIVLLTQNQHMSRVELMSEILDPRLDDVIAQLCNEGLIDYSKGHLSLPGK